MRPSGTNARGKNSLNDNDVRLHFPKTRNTARSPLNGNAPKHGKSPAHRTGERSLSEHIGVVFAVNECAKNPSQDTFFSPTITMFATLRPNRCAASRCKGSSARFAA